MFLVSSCSCSPKVRGKKNCQSGKWILGTVSSKLYVNGLAKTAKTPLHYQWSYCSLAQSHRCSLIWKLQNFVSRASEQYWIHWALEHITNRNKLIFTTVQGSFWVYTQTMRDNVIMQHGLSLAGHVHRMIPSCVNEIILGNGYCHTCRQDKMRNSYWYAHRL